MNTFTTLCLQVVGNPFAHVVQPKGYKGATKQLTMELELHRRLAEPSDRHSSIHVLTCSCVYRLPVSACLHC